jgi:hypothetical protein
VRLVLALFLLVLAGCPVRTPGGPRGARNQPPPPAVTCAEKGSWVLTLTQTSGDVEGCIEFVKSDKYANLGGGAELTRDGGTWHLGTFAVEASPSTQACTPELHVVKQAAMFEKLGAESGEISLSLVIDGDKVTGTATALAGFEDHTCSFTYEVAGASAP